MKSKLTLISILSVALVAAIRGSIIPGMDLLYQEYSSYSMSSVSLIITIPSIMVIPVSYFCSQLVGIKMTYRTTLIIMNLALLIGGVSPSLITNLYAILFLRLIFGIGIGIAISLNKAIIMDYYHDDKQIKYLGYTTIISSLGVIFFQTLIGYLASISTRLMFLGYLPIIITLILSFFIPDIPLKEKQDNKTKSKLNYKLLLISIFFLILNMLISSVGINLATLFSTKNLEDVTIIVVHANNLNSILSMTSGFLFNKIYAKFKNNFFIISLALCSLALFIYIFGQNQVSLYVASGILGFSYNIIVLYIFLLASQITKDKSNAAIGGYMGIAAGIGGFLPSFLVYLCQGLFGESIYSVLIIAIITLSLSALIALKYIYQKTQLHKIN